MDGAKSDGTWVEAANIEALSASGRKLVKLNGRQIALFKTAAGVFACNNRCPHEGYPLIEGVMAPDCVLTCNWHNWKFDLKSGETLVGGDKLRRYPARVADGKVFVDLADPDPDAVIAAALGDLLDSFDDHDYARMAREIARIVQAGGSPLKAVAATVVATHDRFEFGTTHAVAAGTDWLQLYLDNIGDPVRALAVVTECVGHLAWDARLQPKYPYPGDAMPFDAEGFVAAVEAEDAQTAIAMVRGGVDAELSFEDFREPLTRAALAHYQDFGHSLIYVEKTGDFIARAGPEVLQPLLLMLTRSLVFATREDLIPEFAAYGRALAAWETGAGNPNTDVLRIGGVKQVLAEISKGADRPLDVFDDLMAAASWQMQHMDLGYSLATGGPVQDNVSWLNYTHALTFGNAVRRACTRYPALWPQGLLQIGCFLGRNAKYVDGNVDQSSWAVDDPQAFIRDAVTAAADHGQFEYIVAAHILKLSVALDEEFGAREEVPWMAESAAALNRFLNSPLKRKHPLRTANQAIDIVARENA